MMKRNILRFAQHDRAADFLGIVVGLRLDVVDVAGDLLADELLAQELARLEQVGHVVQRVVLLVRLDGECGKVGGARRPNARQEDLLDRVVAELDHHAVAVEHLDHLALQRLAGGVVDARARLRVVLPQAQLGLLSLPLND